MDKWQTQDAFWNSFGIPAYDEQTFFTQGTVASYPHITYQSFGGRLGQEATLSASLWYKSDSWADVKKKADEIQKVIAENEPMVMKMEGGYLWVKIPEFTPFAQPLGSGDDDEKIKRIVLTVEAECLSAF